MVVFSAEREERDSGALTHRLQDAVRDLGSVGFLLCHACHMATVSWPSMAAALPTTPHAWHENKEGLLDK